MQEVVSFFLAGSVFGLSGGLSPGPLMTLVISETLRHNRWAGIKVSLAPFCTDLPIILLSIFVLSRVNADVVLGSIAALGALFLCYLAYESFRTTEVEIKESKGASLQKAIIANFLNPHPYLFWFAVGGPMLLKATEVGLPSITWFLIGFYLFLVGSKIVVALISERSKSFLKSKSYVYVMRTLGVAMLIFAALFFRDALTFFKVL